MTLEGKIVYFLGKLAASNRKEASRIVRQNGGKIAGALSPSVGLVVVGEGDVLSPDWDLWNDRLDDTTREAFEAGTLEIVSESVFWDRCGEGNASPKSDRTLYTPAMLSELTQIPVSFIRKLRQRQLIVPVRQVHRLGYFDLDAVLTLKLAANMFQAGWSQATVMRRLGKIARKTDDSTCEIRVDGKDLYFVTKKGIVDQDGQHRFSFMLDSEIVSADPPASVSVEPLKVLDAVFEPDPKDLGPEVLCEAAWTLESQGDLSGAIQLYRAALVAGGPNPTINFQLAELLYREGDLTAARERYFMAVELDEEFVEARANLGCVLAELGCDDLAAAAFRGALRFHPDYAEVHFHLGTLLDRVGLKDEAREHFRIFLELSPDSPWAEKIPTF